MQGRLNKVYCLEGRYKYIYTSNETKRIKHQIDELFLKLKIFF